MLTTSSAFGGVVEIVDNRYPFSTIWINGRHVSVMEIVRNQAEGRSPFEVHTFEFIRDWLNGAEAFEMTTSGSTGPPKRISVTRRQMMMSAIRTSEKIKLEKYSRALICIDTKYIGGKMMLARSLTLGLRIMAVEPSANPLLKIPIDDCVQFTAFVPYQISAVLESKHPHLLNNIQKLLIGGAPLHMKYASQLDRYLCACYETYGMTETVSHIALRLVNTKGKQAYFETLPGIGIKRDDRGCLVVSADYLPSAIVTNDLVELIEPNKFLWLGRWDNVINTGGVKVTPEKIDNALEKIFLELPVNHRFFIAALPDEKLGNKIVLVLEGVHFSSEILNVALTRLKSAVSPFEFPKEVYSHPGFIMTETKKINRSQTLAGITFLTSAS